MTNHQPPWVQRLKDRFGYIRIEARPPPQKLSKYRPDNEHRFIMVIGKSGSGRTRALVQWMREAQTAGQAVVLLDCDSTYYEGLSCNPEEQIKTVIRPQSRDSAMRIALKLIRSNTVDVLGIDSLFRLPSEYEAKQTMGATARPEATASADSFWTQIARELRGRSCCVLVVPCRSSAVLNHLCTGRVPVPRSRMGHQDP